MKFWLNMQDHPKIIRFKAGSIWQKTVDVWDFSRFIFSRLLADHCVAVAASLTFTTLLALVPLVILTLTIVSAFPVFAEYGASFKGFLFDNLMPESASRVITVYLQQFTENAGKLTAAGLAALSFTALSLMYTIENTLNSIWRVTRPRKLARQVLLYWTLLTLGPILLGVGVSLTASLSLQSVGHLPFMPWFWQLGGLLLNWAMLAMLYGMVPNRFVPLRHALLGGFLGVILLTGARMAFALYVDMARSYELIYGAFATFPILLLWLQLVWLIILLGAEFTAALSYWQDGAWRRRFGDRRRLHDALAALVLLARAQRQGASLSLPQFRAELATGYDEIGQILDILEDHQLILHTQDDRWALLASARQISLWQVYEIFLETSHSSDTAVGVVLQDLMYRGSNAAALSLAEFCELVEAKSAQAL